MDGSFIFSVNDVLQRRVVSKQEFQTRGPHMARKQRRIFIFRAQGYFKLVALLKGLRRLMSYKLALHVLVSNEHELHSLNKLLQFINVLTTLFSIHSISGTKTVTMKLTKKAAVKLSDHTPITYLLGTSLTSRTSLPGSDEQKLPNCTSKIPNSFKNAKQAETGQWLSISNYLDE